MDGARRHELVLRANTMVANGKTAAACRLLQRSSERDPDPMLRSWLGIFLVEHEDYEQAVPLLEDALERTPGFLQPAMALVQIPLRQQRYDQAVATYDAVVEHVPRLRTALRSTSQTSRTARAFAELCAAGGSEDGATTVFYHLPFTAGTSSQRVFNFAFGPAERFNVRRSRGLPMLAKYQQLSARRIERLRYVHLHHPFPLEPHGRSLRYCTTLREPVGRFFSGHHKRLQSPVVGGGEWRDGHIPSIEEAVAHHGSSGTADGQARQLAILHPSLRERFVAISRPRRLSRRIRIEDDLHYAAATADLSRETVVELAKEVIETQFMTPVVLEHLEAGSLATFAELGMPIMLRPPHIAGSRFDINEVDPALVARIADLNQGDADLYDWAKKRFLTRHGRLAQAVAAERKRRTASSNKTT